MESFCVYGRDEGGPFLLVSDHAGQAIPDTLGDLGVSAEERARHIGWDIGIDGVGQGLAEALPALLIEQVFSRLVIDCNRAPGHPTSIVRESDGTAVPGNQSLCAQQSSWREQAILHPYHERIRAELDARQARGQVTCLIALHSFTPVMRGYVRPWQAGILHNRDSRLAHIMLDLLRGEGLCVGDNEPYALTDTSDYTVPEHAERRGLPYIEIEIRQDLITSVAGQEEWVARLARLLPAAWRIFCETYGERS
ncbi:N-formylglutamate amidohydrolase [Acetobacter peroxydans]|uniref:N-formylglutamate amidohydrolase n=1 Tax=Acetobacter peroxydans TaxID=104098 RepID=A0A4Y3TPI5_9PROT|nr:N-formylglutamate amidohydrolase [Acetobacter peroxydans]GBR37047.1 N-formylglutamate amidohydrolase [Acetobacter peroxydans NBRC 13755]GBR41311.1 N-formylglutamate amidohydrolase [Acetobacter peroxydans]GEB84256.1 N-formylglutamate amidohydrolase [Acetobacter peroxydans]